MSRPKLSSVARRRRKIQLFLFAAGARDETSIARLSKLVNTNERTVRADLEAIREELESDSGAIRGDLATAIEEADTFKALKAVGKRVSAEMLRGTIDRELGNALMDNFREQRHVLRSARDEESHAALMAIDVLTPQEQELLEKYRASLTPPSLKPGEFPAPPEGAPLPADFEGPPPATDAASS